MFKKIRDYFSLNRKDVEEVSPQDKEEIRRQNEEIEELMKKTKKHK